MRFDRHDKSQSMCKFILYDSVESCSIQIVYMFAVMRALKHYFFREGIRVVGEVDWCKFECEIMTKKKIFQIEICLSLNSQLTSTTFVVVFFAESWCVRLANKQLTYVKQIPCDGHEQKDRAKIPQREKILIVLTF
jgi:hypothetical protein